jgi:acetyltransferase-like isoleucine patch superfamily enzyme
LLLIDENRLPTSKNESNKYDLIWFRTFDFASKLKTSSKLIHAYGFEENEKNISIENEILRLRLNKDFKSRVDLHSHEFSKSPVWDYKYFELQIQKGLNSFYNIEIRKTNLIESSKNIKVGKFSFFNKNLIITGDEYVSIGSFCSFGKDITVYTSNHDTNYPSTQGFIYRKYFKVNHPGEVKINPSKSRTKGPVLIKNDVWIGDGVKVMSGVTIGNGACIAAGSIVTKDIDDYSIVAGVPAKRISFRFNENIRQQLLDLNWWDWSDTKIENNKAFFSTDLNTIENISNLIN